MEQKKNDLTAAYLAIKTRKKNGKVVQTEKKYLHPTNSAK
jgi:hypothetical protein